MRSSSRTWSISSLGGGFTAALALVLAIIAAACAPSTALAAGKKQAAPVTAAPAGRALIEESFVQPLSANAAWSEERWSAEFDAMKAAGVSQVVMQWTAYGQVAFTPGLLAEFPPEGVDLADQLIELAEARGMSVRLGLPHDPDWWNWLKSPAEPLDGRLRGLLAVQAHAIRVLSRFATRPGFAGFYVPEEIDDATWLEPAKRSSLLEHLRAISVAAREAAPGASVAVCGFSNGRTDPPVLAGFWSEVLTYSGVDRLYFQDGVGAGKLSPRELTPYLRALSEATDGELVLVVELFRAGKDQKAEQDVFTAAPADPASVRERLLLAGQTLDKGVGKVRVAVFNMPDYMTPHGSPEARALYAAIVSPQKAPASKAPKPRK